MLALKCMQTAIAAPAQAVTPLPWPLNAAAALPARCECPIGYVGDVCDKPLWPACRVAPDALEMYCGTWHPKACDCVAQCAATICPDGPASCERHFDAWNAKCFTREAGAAGSSSGAGNKTAAAAAAMYSDIPAEGEPGVKYFKGLRGSGMKPAPGDEITRWVGHSGMLSTAVASRCHCMRQHVLVGLARRRPAALTARHRREEFLDMEPHAADGLAALPLSACPERCSLQGGCVRRKNGGEPHCLCHYGFAGNTCREADYDRGAQHVCYNNCQVSVHGCAPDISLPAASSQLAAGLPCHARMRARARLRRAVARAGVAGVTARRAGGARTAAAPKRTPHTRHGAWCTSSRCTRTTCPGR